MHPGWEGLCQHRRDEGGRQHAMDDPALEGSRAREALVEVHRVVIVRRLRKQQKVFLRKGLGICRRLSDVDVVEVVQKRYRHRLSSWRMKDCPIGAGCQLKTA